MRPVFLKRCALAPCLFLATGATAAQTTTAAPVVVAGAVPDEATKAAVLSKLRGLYGDERVVDRIEVDAVAAPANWRQHVTAMIGPDLQQVSDGKLEIDGNRVHLSGQVADALQGEQITRSLKAALNPTYAVTSELHSGGGKQNLLDRTLADRIVEFQSGSATLTPAGQAILDEMAAALKQVGNTRVQLIGHTDSVGARQANIDLSMARATTVKTYLESQGVADTHLGVIGRGPDEPVADNATTEGRARNRRIEFRVL